MSDLFTRVGRGTDEHARYVTRLRAHFGKKRNFIKLLDAAAPPRPDAGRAPQLFPGHPGNE